MAVHHDGSVVIDVVGVFVLDRFRCWDGGNVPRVTLTDAGVAADDAVIIFNTLLLG